MSSENELLWVIAIAIASGVGLSSGVQRSKAE